MSSIICLDAVEVLGVGLNTSSRLTFNPTERPQDKSAGRSRAHVVAVPCIFALFAALPDGACGNSPTISTHRTPSHPLRRQQCSDD